MATKYGYVERSADSYVNWADVGRTMTSTIDAIQQEREDKKTLIDESYRSELKYIMEAPSGEHEGLRNWSLNYSQTAAENLKLQHQLFKQGKTRINDYTSFRQKITDNTDNLYKTIGGIQESFKEKMDRLKNDESQNLEGYIMDQLTKYGDLSNTESIINPLTGDVTIALTEEVIENGQKIRRAVKDPTKRLTVNDLMAAVNVKYDNYNPLADIEKWVKTNGEVIQVMHELGADMKVGSLTEMKDVTWAQILEEYTAQGRPQNEIDRAKAAFDKFKESETSFAKSLTANPFKELAILTNQMKYDPISKKQYVFSEDPNHKGGTETILIERLKDGSIKPLLTDKQNAAALGHITTLAYGMYDKTKKMTTYTGPQTPRPERVQSRSATEADYKARGELNEADALGSEIGKLYSKDVVERNAVLAGFSKYTGVANLYFDADDSGSNVTIRGTSLNGTAINIPMITNGVPASVISFGNAFAAAVGKQELANQYKKKFDDSLTPHSTWNTDWNKDNRGEFFKKPKKKAAEIQLQKDFASLPQADAVNSINNTIASMGLKDYKAVGTATVYGYHRINIVGPDGKNLFPEDLKSGYKSDKTAQIGLQYETLLAKLKEIQAPTD